MSLYESYTGEIYGNDFKRNETYNAILEHVTKKMGEDYLRLIETEFPVTFEQFYGYIALNDANGQPRTCTFYSKKFGKQFTCSPTSLRYVYHALLILQHFKECSSTEIVEVGCGYGGLCLAINYFPCY